MKSKQALAFALACALLAACKPTPRTATAAKDPTTHQTGEAEAPQTPEPEAQPPVTPARSLLDISTTRQDYNRLRPWEKANPSSGSFMGVYLGQGRVLTVGRAARAATYMEIALPDQSRRVTARVLKYDEGLELALLTVEHPEDASIFDSMPALEIGSPLSLGQSAELWSLVQGVTPVSTGLVAESADEGARFPQLSMRSEKPLPSGVSVGLPILKEGRIVGLITGVDNRDQSVNCVNAELISRFLDASTPHGDSTPVVGVSFAELDDPIFAKYLKLSPEQGGLYVNEVMPGSAAQAAGIRKGDVLTSIDGLQLDKLGRCKHPLYGLISAQEVIRSLKPLGQQISLGISRDGQQLELPVQLNRDAVDKSLFGVELPGVAPRYIMWGGLLFQPASSTYLQELENRAHSLPLPILSLKDREQELMAEGRTELVLLTLVIPTPATLSYDTLGFCLVEKVNGKRIHNFAEFAELLDTPTPDGLVELTLNRSPYTIHIDRQTAEAANDLIRRRAIPRLRQMGGSSGK